jgi:hypothetical protein
MSKNYLQFVNEWFQVKYLTQCGSYCFQFPEYFNLKINMDKYAKWSQSIYLQSSSEYEAAL